MLDEDLSLFLNTGEFAVAATIKNSSNVAVRTANVIRDLPQETIMLYIGDQIRSDAAFVLAKTADVADVRNDWKLVIEGVTYRVSGTPKRIDDGAFSIVEVRA